MAAQNWIGPYSFLSLEGTPRGIGHEMVLIQRPGVDGSAVWMTGQRGQPFTLRSAVDAFTLGYAVGTLYKDYRTLLAGVLTDLIWNNLPMTDSATRAKVLDVEMVRDRTFAMIGGVGGLCPPSYGWLECDWKIILI